MKKLLSIVFLFLVLNSFSQDIFYYQAITYSLSYKEDGNWTKFSDWKECSITVTVDYDTRVIYINNKGRDKFTVTRFEDSYTNNGYSIVPFKCKDKDNLTCSVKIVEAPNKTLYCHIEYDNLIVMYGLNAL